MYSKFQLNMTILVLIAVGVVGAAIAVPTVGVSAIKPTATPTPPKSAPVQSGLRRPVGVYAHLDLTGLIRDQKKTNRSIKPDQLVAQLTSMYQNLLANPGVSGLTVGVHWSLVNPNPPSAANAYDWSYLDAAFSQVSAWNTKNPTKAPKTVQLIVTAGFNSPQWVLDQLPSCDGLFKSAPQNAANNCGKATFKGFVEAAEGDVLPLPWNPVYKNDFKTFMMALAAHYESNPAFVSISVGGPTAASDEMFVPDNTNSDNPQTQFGANISPNDMWLKLLALQYPDQPAYQNTDQAFIDEWINAIDMYGQIFKGITLVVLPAAGGAKGGGFPEFSPDFPPPPSTDKLFTEDCSSPNMSCAAITTILTHFIDPAVGGANAKATQTSGLKAYNPKANLGVPAVKFLSSLTASLPPSAQILGGEQYDHPFSTDSTFMGCLTKQCTEAISPEQAEYNVLRAFFDGTSVAESFGGTPGTARLNYLQDGYEDIQYSTDHANTPVEIVQADGSKKKVTAQDMLSLANQNLLQIAEINRAQ